MPPKKVLELISRAAPTVVEAMEKWCGQRIFDRRILEETGDKIRTYRGYDACFQGAQVLQIIFKENGVDDFGIVSDPTRRQHFFLHDKSSSPVEPIIADATHRQFWFHRSMDLALQRIFASDEKLARELNDYMLSRLPQRNLGLAAIVQESLGDLPVVFLGTPKKLREEMTTFGKKVDEAYKFGPTITNALVEDAMSHYRAPWQLISEIKNVASEEMDGRSISGAIPASAVRIIKSAALKEDPDKFQLV